MLIAAGQLCSSTDLAENGLMAAKLISEAAKNGARVIYLPEASDYIAKDAIQSRQIVKSFEESPFVSTIVDIIKSLDVEGTPIDVSVGIHEPADDGRTKNTLVYLNSKGELQSRYQKIHLFDVDIPNGPILKESQSVQPGSKIVPPIQTPVGKLGQLICYDLRFPELALSLRAKNAQILTYPSAWTIKTGPHFQKLGRAMAILAQCFVILPAQFGKHRGTLNRESFGHTCIIDPHGDIMAECSKINEICYADIDVSVLDPIRTGMPIMDHRRPDIYFKQYSEET